jgi:hypothetical protein
MPSSLVIAHESKAKYIFRPASVLLINGSIKEEEETLTEA